MATIHVPTTDGLLRSLSMIAAARGTTMREEVNEACRAHVERESHHVLSAAREMAAAVDQPPQEPASAPPPPKTDDLLPHTMTLDEFAAMERAKVPREGGERLVSGTHVKMVGERRSETSLPVSPHEDLDARTTKDIDSGVARNPPRKLSAKRAEKQRDAHRDSLVIRGKRDERSYAASNLDIAMAKLRGLDAGPPEVVPAQPTEDPTASAR